MLLVAVQDTNEMCCSVTPNASRPARREENHYAKAQQAEQMRALRYKVLQQRQTLEELDRFM